MKKNKSSGLVCETRCVERAIADSTADDHAWCDLWTFSTSRSSPSRRNVAWIDLQRLSSKAKSWAIATIKDNELRLEEDVAEDGEADASVGLNATEAS